MDVTRIITCRVYKQKNNNGRENISPRWGGVGWVGWGVAGKKTNSNSVHVAESSERRGGGKGGREHPLITITPRPKEPSMYCMYEGLTSHHYLRLWDKWAQHAGVSEGGAAALQRMPAANKQITR